MRSFSGDDTHILRSRYFTRPFDLNDIIESIENAGYILLIRWRNPPPEENGWKQKMQRVAEPPRSTNVHPCVARRTI
jgi:hypothetical protein